MKNLKTIIGLVLVAGIAFFAAGCKPKASAQPAPQPAKPISAKKLRLTDSQLCDVIDEIRLNELTYEEASGIAIRREYSTIGVERIAGDYLIYSGVNWKGHLFRVALLRDKKQEEQELLAGDFHTVEEYYADMKMSKSMDSRDPINRNGFLRIAGTAHFTTRNGVMIELPRIESVPVDMVDTSPR